LVLLNKLTNFFFFFYCRI